MYFYDTQRLVRLAIDNDILHTEDGCVAIYREVGSDPEIFPEGWYLEDVDDVAQDLIEDAKGQRCLTEALAEKGVIFHEEGPAISSSIAQLLHATGDVVRFEERKPGEFWADI